MVPQNGFIKQVGGLTGKEKAAVLLGELGFTADMLHDFFSDDELKKIRKGFASIKGQYDVNVESSVLQETVAYGISRNIVAPDAIYMAEQNAIEANAKYMASAKASRAGILPQNGINAQDLANVLSMWLKEE